MTQKLNQQLRKHFQTNLVGYNFGEQVEIGHNVEECDGQPTTISVVSLRAMSSRFGKTTWWAWTRDMYYVEALPAYLLHLKT